MDVIELLREQQRKEKELLQAMVGAEDRRQRRNLLGEVSKALRLHARLVEKLVYPAASRALQGGVADPVILLAYEEHGAALRALQTLEETSPADKRFTPRAKVLQTLVEHVGQEEEQILPELQQKLGPESLARLNALVERRLTSFQEEVSAAPPARRAKTAARGREAARPQPRQTRRTAATAQGMRSRPPRGRAASSARGATRSGPTRSGGSARTGRPRGDTR